MKIFFSYAPEDTLLFRDFERSLELLKKVEGLEFTNSHMSLPHENVNEVVSNAMLQADLIFVLLSDDYFSTISCAAELKLATQWHKQNQKIMLADESPSNNFEAKDLIRFHLEWRVNI